MSLVLQYFDVVLYHTISSVRSRSDSSRLFHFSLQYFSSTAEDLVSHWTPFSSLNPCTFPGRAQSFFPLLRLLVSFKPHRREAELLPARTARPPQRGGRACHRAKALVRSRPGTTATPRRGSGIRHGNATRPEPTGPEAAARAGTASAGAEPAQQLVRWGVRPSEHRARSRGFTEPASQPHVRVWPAEAVPAPPQALRTRHSLNSLSKKNISSW